MASRKTIAIEATANQVNQSGGYTGMTPADFAAYIHDLCEQSGWPGEQFILGMDHLGPHVWAHESTAAAMDKAGELVRYCIRAGFRKLHLDTVSGNRPDPAGPGFIEQIAQQAAQLCRIAEDSARSDSALPATMYVIGADVPTPGGGLATEAAAVTDPHSLTETISVFKTAFLAAGLEQAWNRVVAIVVQPGVDFGDLSAAPYDGGRAAALAACHLRLPPGMTFEIHAADYQAYPALEEMVRDHFNLLKIGPCLTFAMREALYALAYLEEALPGVAVPSDLRRTIEAVMTRQPQHWQSHYHGTPDHLYYLRHYSLRDRVRYYWTFPPIRAAVDQLLSNLNRPIPLALIKQFLPDVPAPFRNTYHPMDPEAFITYRIGRTLQPYLEACRPKQ